MGVGRVGDDDWLLVDEHRDEQLALKRRLLADHRDEVLALHPDIDTGPAATELLQMVVRRGTTRDRVEPESRDSLEVAAASVQEDLCVLLPDEKGRLVLAAGCVCFPSHWRLRDKVGRPAATIHGPVPRYDVELAGKVDTFLDRLRPPTVMRRRNWMIHESADLFAPDAPASADLSIPPEDLWLRSERQTLRRLPVTGAVVFTIRTQQVRISALASRPDVAAALAARLDAQPDDIARYAGYSDHVPSLLHRLRTWLG